MFHYLILTAGMLCAAFPVFAAAAADAPPAADSLAAGEPYLLANPMPAFNGGSTLDFCHWVQERLRYPAEAVIYGIEGRVVIGFVIEPDGSVSSVEALTSPDPSLSEAAMHVVRQSPRWSPGRLDGKPVRVWLSIPIDFSLEKLPAGTPPDGAELPEFQGGGLVEFKRWVLRNIEFSDKIFNPGDEGWVEVSFTVNKNGKVRQVQPTRFSDEDFAEQIRRTIASSPSWTPAESEDAARDVLFQLRFDLSLMPGDKGLYTEDKTIYTEADSLPRFCGGTPGVFREWMFRQVDSLLGPGVPVPKARIVLRFVVERDGTVTGIGVSAPKEREEFAKLVRRAVDASPLWTPAVLGGERIRFRVSQELRFGEDNPEEEHKADSIDVYPKFAGGGLEEFRRWVVQKVVYPWRALEKGIQGRVAVSFIVEKDGSVSSMEILQSPDPILSREVERVLKKAPAWTPGMKDGKPVRVRYTLPVDFKTQQQPRPRPVPAAPPIGYGSRS